MGFRRKLRWLILVLMPLLLFTGCGDLEPDMQDTRTVILNMDFHGKSSSRSSSSVSASELSQYNTHLILALPSREYLTSSYKNYYSSFAQGLMNTADKKVSLEIPLNTQMKIFAFLFKENYSMSELFSGTREVGYYGESQSFSIGTQTNNLSLGITLIQVPGTGTDTGGGTDTTAPTVTFSPFNGATGVAISDNIIITFSEAVRNIDNTVLTDSNVDNHFTLKLTNASGNNINFDATINGDKTVITINPTSNLTNSQAVYVAIGATVEDSAGIPITAANATFTTGGSGDYGGTDTTAPTAPSVSGTTPTNDTTPTWSWSTGGGGNGTYRYKLDNSDLTSGATQTTSTSYTPGSGISEGSHILYVQERDAAGNWSSSGSRTIVIDTTAPTAPSVSGTTPTNSTTPTWSWSPGGGGNGTYRYKLDNSDLTSGATQTTSTSYTPGSGISVGSHTLYVQEQNAAGNWSSSGSRTIVIDTTAPSVDNFTLSDTALKAGDNATVTLRFSEAVVSFSSAADITADNGTLAAMSSADNITWTGTFTPTANTEDASNTLSLANSWTDTVGNTGTAATTSNFEVETLAPTVSSFTLSDTALKAGDNATVTLVFSEAVASFSSDADITAAGTAGAADNGTFSTLNSATTSPGLEPSRRPPIRKMITTRFRWPLVIPIPLVILALRRQL